jgi:hypothetical protein
MVRTPIPVPILYCDMGFHIACVFCSVSVVLAGSVTWLAASIQAWRAKPNPEQAQRPRSRARKALAGPRALRAARFFLAAAVLLHLLGFLYYFVARPATGTVFGITTSALLLLIIMLAGGIALIRSAMLAWESLGPGVWTLRIGSSLLCALLLGGAYLITVNLSQMNQSNCGVFPIEIPR